MNKLFLFMVTTLDGYAEGENHDLSWHHIDEEFDIFAKEQTDSAGVILFGRKTYEMMASYWTDDAAADENPKEIVDQMNETPKVVFSKTLQSANWNHTTLEHEVSKDVIDRIKGKTEKDVVIFGSSDLCVSLLSKGLLDEVRILVNPVILGKGKVLFDGIESPVKLELTKTREFKNGNVLLTYHVMKE